MEQKAYPSDMSDEEWGFVAPYLTLMTEEASHHHYSLRDLIKLPHVKKGFVLSPHYSAVERSLGWTARDYERLPEILIGLLL